MDSRETPASLRAMGKIIGTQDGELGRRPRSFPNADAQRGYDEGYARGRAYAVKHKGARLNPSDGMSTFEWLGLGVIGAVILYAVFKPAEASATNVIPLRSVNPTATPATTNLTAADHAVIRGVQDRLRLLGFDPGPSTGDWNHQTNYALSFFQRDVMGIDAPTGVLDGATAVRLENASNARVQVLNDAAANERESTFWSAFSLFRNL